MIGPQGLLMDGPPATSPHAAQHGALCFETSQDYPMTDTTGHNSSPQAAISSKPPRAPHKQSKSNKAVQCKFFTQPGGCRAGNACPFSHETEASTLPADRSRADAAPSSSSRTDHGGGISPKQPGNTRDSEDPTLSMPQPARRTAVSRPVAPQQTVDPRKFEITQLKRRFSPTVREDEGVTILVFTLVPSDPDFPFEVAALHVNLSVPQAYPGNAQPSIRIDNPEMERGYQINVERGFHELVVKHPSKTLLALMHELDKNLESFLMSRKARTVKLVANAENMPTQSRSASLLNETHVSDIVVPSTKELYSKQQLQDARQKRESDIRQIEARMGREPRYSKSSDGYNIPLHLPKTGRLPVSLQSTKDVRLTVPQLYPLEACQIHLKEGSREAELVELAFQQRAIEYRELSLTAHINHLVQNMHIMTREPAVTEVEPKVTLKTAQHYDTGKDVTQTEEAEPRQLDQDRPHVLVIPRPPEWDMDAALTDDEEFDTSETDISETDEDGGAELVIPDVKVANRPKQGVLISFPSLELYGIELLQISALSITVQCSRCKGTTDFMDVKPLSPSGEVSGSPQSCKKCQSSLSIAYHSEPMHINSIRAGLLDLDGCTVVDLLPSHFQATCSECSTTSAKPGIVSVRGETSMTMCRNCYTKMIFKLPEVNFLRVSSAERPLRPLARKKAKENLGIIAGTQLPQQGRCRHYARSYRWFRFSCCGKVYPCDRCHDAAEEHLNEHANRMICGLCSREQHYRPENCAFCHSNVTGKRSGGFWEGGKGTRDKVKMNRKDPRKYKRRGGGTVGTKAK